MGRRCQRSKRGRQHAKEAAFVGFAPKAIAHPSHMSGVRRMERRYHFHDMPKSLKDGGDGKV